MLLNWGEKSLVSEEFGILEEINMNFPIYGSTKNIAETRWDINLYNFSTKRNSQAVDYFLPVQKISTYTMKLLDFNLLIFFRKGSMPRSIGQRKNEEKNIKL